MNIKGAKQLKKELDDIKEQQRVIKETFIDEINTLKELYHAKLENVIDDADKRVIMVEYDNDIEKVRKKINDGEYSKLDEKRNKLEYLIKSISFISEESPSTGINLWGNEIDELKEKYRHEDGLLPQKYYETDKANFLDDLKDDIDSTSSSDLETIKLTLTATDQTKILAYYTLLKKVRDALEKAI